jgi:hypothetical protein
MVGRESVPLSHGSDGMGRTLRDTSEEWASNEVSSVAQTGCRSQDVHRSAGKAVSSALSIDALDDKHLSCSEAVWWAWEDLNLGPHPYQGSAPGPVSPGSHLAPGRTTYRWRPLETVVNRSAPMACGPNVDQIWLGVRVRVVSGRGRLRRSSPRDRGRIGRLGAARPIGAVNLVWRWTLQAPLSEALRELGNALVADSDRLRVCRAGKTAHELGEQCP